MTTASGRSEHADPLRGAYPNQPVVAVGAVVFSEDSVFQEDGVFRKGAVLLVKRGKPPSRGQWAIPGGSVHLGETLQAAAERELIEETGITVRAGDPVLTFDTVQRNTRGQVQYHYVIVDLEATYLAGEPRAGDDAADARWVTVDDLQALDVAPATRKLLRDQYGFGS
jgi:8-oxo-dGTP diphosphatase